MTAHMTARPRPMDAGVDLSVYLVTDTAQCAARGRTVAETVAQAVAGGVTAVQIREKHASGREFLCTVLDVAEVLPEHVALIVNDRVDVFLAARANGARVTGVHVGQSDLPATAVRQLIGDDAVLGLSAATAQELNAAAVSDARVDHVGIGALHTTRTKDDAPEPLGLDGFAALAGSSALPAVAIGGVIPADLPHLRAGGAAGAAIVSGICAADDPLVAARTYADAWSDSRDTHTRPRIRKDASA
ncbi:thiamine phosphate synthase [Streptomyces sp. NBC_01016]|uniref:thiamine phosphate synthase n=1 Tax=Streptomyces sp. NBC_01016 TaxID=2903720 RepID=UPI00224C9AAF|nr:thiamine phosphate synthase [Streptomyces sp. NBC_01016]MCX4831461.1 thiamine phosphate synthase [Streptomyces sp. NBC_01016]